MINNVSIKTVDSIKGCYDVFFDGVQVADKIHTLSIFMEAGSVPHMIMDAHFLNLELDNVPMSANTTQYETQSDEISGDIQHVGYDDSQLGRDK